jgi:hypothetical protein
MARQRLRCDVRSTVTATTSARPRANETPFTCVTLGPRNLSRRTTFKARCRGLLASKRITYDFLALQLPYLGSSESMGNHDSDIVDADGVG